MAVSRAKMGTRVNRIKQLDLVDYTEKAGVGGSIPSLATMFSTTYSHPKTQHGSNWFQFDSQRCVSNFEPESEFTLTERRGISEKRKPM
jgi:hypothetical protein